MLYRAYKSEKFSKPRINNATGLPFVHSSVCEVIAQEGKFSGDLSLECDDVITKVVAYDVIDGEQTVVAEPFEANRSGKFSLKLGTVERDGKEYAALIEG